MVEIREYLDAQGRSPCAKWFNRLDAQAAAEVVTALIRMDHGNRSDVKGAGEGVLECRIDFGPGYRVYFGKDGDAVIVLLGGGAKKRQQRDITTARNRWREYKRRQGTGGPSSCL